MSVRDDFIKDIVDLMGKEGSFDFDRRISILTGIMLKYKDFLPGDEVEDIVAERKNNIKSMRELEGILDAKKDGRTGCSVSEVLRGD